MKRVFLLLSAALLVTILGGSPAMATGSVTASGVASYSQHFFLNVQTYRTGDMTVSATFSPIKSNTAAVVWLTSAEGHVCYQSEDGRRGQYITGTVGCTILSASPGTQTVEFWPWSGSKLNVTVTVTGETDP